MRRCLGCGLAADVDEITGHCLECLEATQAATRRRRPHFVLEPMSAVEAAGRKAAAAGGSESDCPYPQGLPRYWWFRGYYEAKAKGITEHTEYTDCTK